MSKRAVIKWDSAGEPYVEIIDLPLPGPKEIAPRLWYTPDSDALPDERWNQAVKAQLAKAEENFRYFGLPGTVGPDALCELEVHEDGRLVPRVFARCEFIPGQQEFAQFRGELRKGGVTSFARLETTTGLCLLSGTGVIARTASGQEFPLAVQASSHEITEPIVSLTADSRLSLYAFDSAATLTPCNAAYTLAALRQGLDAAVNNDTPGEGHYGQYVLDNMRVQAAEAGGRLPDEARELYAAFRKAVLDNRKESVELFWRALRDKLGEEGKPIKVLSPDQLKDIGPYLLQKVRSEKRNALPEMKDLIGVLLNNRPKDWLWNAIMFVAPPTTVKEFTGRAYVYVVLKAGITFGDAPRRICLCIENDTEGPILAEAQRIFALIESMMRIACLARGERFPGMEFNAQGVYVRGHVFPCPQGPVDGRVSVYAHAPGGYDGLRLGDRIIPLKELVRMIH